MLFVLILFIFISLVFAHECVHDNLNHQELIDPQPFPQFSPLKRNVEQAFVKTDSLRLFFDFDELNKGTHPSRCRKGFF